MMKDNKKIYRTAVYLRLSKGDSDVDGCTKSESNSITNQRMICENFLKKNPDLKFSGFYIDDGFTGTNFDRPEMKRMLDDVDAGLIDCIVVKDLSRFGRERIETGTYIARTFKEKGIRFIAINDHYDTLTADGSETHIVMPIKALTNDNFSRDISTKVRSSQEIKMEKGDFIGAFAMYGYRKSLENKNVLIPDEYAAGIVKEIFADRLKGLSASAIAQKLNDAGILSPAEYKKKQGQKYSTSFQGAGISRWSAQTVIRILKDEVYTGVMAQGKRVKVSYKVKKEIRRPKSEWVRVENTHQAIVDQRTFDSVQMLLQRDTIRVADRKEPYLYSGLIYCADCGMSMIRRSDTYGKGRKVVNYICSNYNRNRQCSRHTIRESELTESILETLRSWIEIVADADRLAQRMNDMTLDYDSALEHDREIAELRKELLKYDTLKSSLYQDLKDGLINETQFNRYREEYTNRGIKVRDAIAEQERIIRDIYDKGIGCGMDLDMLREKLNIGQIDRVLLVTLVDRILIHKNGDIEVILKMKDEIGKVKTLAEMAGFEMTGEVVG